MRVMSLIIGIVMITALTGCSRTKENKLTIYGYESLSWMNDKIKTDFETKTGAKLDIVTNFQDTHSIVSRLMLEKKHPQCDVVIGLNMTALIKAKKEDLLQKYKPKTADLITNNDLVIDTDYSATSFDYGSIAIIYNPELKSVPPVTFKDLISDKKSLIIQDPRMSSTGTDFLLWTIAYFGAEWENYWVSLKPSIASVSPGWGESFALFENKEAPMMISYATDPAYSFHNYQSVKYQALIPESKGFIQLECAGIVRGSKNRKLAEKFIDYILTEDFQNEIPLNQWMFPVTDVKLPEAYKYAVKPDTILKIDAKQLADNIDKYLSRWEEIMKQ